MNLAVDIGNSFAKLALLEEGQIVDTFRTALADEAFFASVLRDYPTVDRAILLSSRGDVPDVERWLAKQIPHFIRFDASVPVPIRNGYATPETLGPDRLAAAVGARSIYPDAPVFVVDFGTAITLDLVTADGEYLGGNISPGVAMRFHALHDHTRTLPLCELPQHTETIGRNTSAAIESGVVLGIVREVEGYIRELEERYSGLKIIFTGGDANYFAKRLKSAIFATCDLVVYGLNTILEYNAKLFQTR